MKDGKMISLLLILVATILGGVGQFLFKYAFLDGLLLLTVGAGLCVYALSTAFYFYVLSRVNLSWAYGLNGITYILAVVFAATILSEKVPLIRWGGVFVIVAGVVLISIS